MRISSNVLLVAYDFFELLTAYVAAIGLEDMPPSSQWTGMGTKHCTRHPSQT